MANVRDCDIAESKFKLQSIYYAYFWEKYELSLVLLAMA